MNGKTILILILINCIKPFNTSAQIVIQDSLALVDIYNKTAGPNWKNHTNWLTQKPVSTWYGVLQVNNRVTQINLVDNNLSGTIAASIGNLTALSYLALAYNNLGGTIPLSLGNLTDLTFVSLKNNQLSGGIPVSLGNLLNLSELYLQFNKLSGIPASIGSLSKLTRLEISNNTIGGSIPADLGNLTSLRFLTLEANKFTGSIPPSFGKLQNLTVLALSYNQLTGTIPTEIGDLSSLVYLYLQGNRLEGNIPPSLASISRLNSLTLADNKISGTIPLGLLQVNQLTLANNFFTFTDIEPIAYRQFGYAPQGNIKLTRLNERLSASAGGTLINNTYTWYKTGGGIVAIIKADSTFRPAAPGDYYVKVTNDIAIYLTLQSDTLKANAVTIQVCPKNTSTIMDANAFGTSYRWQLDSTGLGQYHDITNNNYYSGTNTFILQLNNIPSGWDGYRYRCLINGITSTVFIIQFENEWVGFTDQNWENPLNWTCNTVPDINTDVIINGAIVLLNQSTTVKTLKVINNASVTIGNGANLIIRF